MIVKTEQDYNNFLNENSIGRCIMHVIGNNDSLHGAVNRPLILFIKNIDSQKTYVLNIQHYDVQFSIDKSRLINDLNNLYCIKFVFDKKRFLHILPIVNLKDLKLIDFMENGVIEDDDVYPKNYKFYYNRFKKFNDINNSIPISIHTQYFMNICDDYEDTVKTFKEDDGYVNINDNIIENLQKIESHGLYVNSLEFESYFEDKEIRPVNNLVFTEYNIYTSTGRPSNRFGGINYAALDKKNGCRNSFISRHGDAGMLFLIDYSAYHPHIVAKLINYELPREAYEYLGKYYYKKDELSPTEVKMAKNFTFQCMYDDIPKELLDIPYFKKMDEYIKHRWEFFSENSYVETPLFKRKITNKHILDPKPSKLFNYILQASETEFGMSVLANINKYLENKKTKPIIYTYDSLLYDVHKDDGKQTLVDIKNIMASKDFPIKCFIGHTYQTMVPVII